MATTARRRGLWWLVAAAALLVAGAWLMFSADPPLRPDPPSVHLPTRMTAQGKERSDARRTLYSLPPMSDAGVPLAVAPPPRDPVLAMMPPTVKRVAMVAEFNAIVNSDVGALMMNCLFSGSPEDEGFLARLRDAGVDPGTSIDRVGIVDDSLVVSGNFSSGALSKLLTDEGGRAPTVKDYGERGKLYEWALADGGVVASGTWGDQLLVGGGGVDAVKAMLDRVGSRAGGEAVPGALTEDQAYGEVYGVITPDAIGRLIGTRDQGLADTFRQAATGVRLHADVSHDVGLVADIEGEDSSKTEQLRRALGGALSLGRLQAQRQGRDDEAQLLDGARVSAAGDGKFRLQAGLPYETMKKFFSECVESKRRARLDAGQAP